LKFKLPESKYKIKQLPIWKQNIVFWHKNQVKEPNISFRNRQFDDDLMSQISTNLKKAQIYIDEIIKDSRIKHKQMKMNSADDRDDSLRK